MDIKTAFLNGELEEKIYMTHPDGFVVKCQENKVCKLMKYLYDLKQAPKQWHEKFDVTLISVDFSVNGADRCVLPSWWGSGSYIMLVCRWHTDL
jgi:hypothetical protein